MPSIVRACLAFAALVLAACSGNSRHTIRVRVISDFVAGPEAGAARTTLLATDTGLALEVMERALYFGDALERGLDVATLSHVPTGTHTVSVALLRADGTLLASRPLIFSANHDTTLTVHITADCQDVQCPNATGGPALSACLQGTCVDPRCDPTTEEGLAFCPENLFCSNDDHCAAGRSACTDGKCAQGVCIDAPREDACEEGEYCARDRGCTPIGSMHEDDDPRCGTICEVENEPCRYGYYACTTSEESVQVVCTPFVARSEGSACASGTCDGMGHCIATSQDGGVDSGPADAGIDAALDASRDAGDAQVLDLSRDFGADSRDLSIADFGADARDAAPDMPAFTLADASIDAAADAPEQGDADVLVELDADILDAAALDAYVADAATLVDAAPDAPPIVDVDECTLGTDTCSTNQHCTNTIGSFQCHDIAHVFAGGRRTYVVFDNGDVKGWGYGRYGEIGNGVNVSRAVADSNRLPFVGAVEEVSVGSSHTCATLSNGDMQCWGSNWDGRLGYGDNSGRTQPPEEPIALPDDVVKSDTGEQHTCVLLLGGGVRCWGYAGFDALGYGDHVNRNSPPPTDVPLGANAIDLAVGAYFSCALLESGTVQCWGSNSQYQLGNGDTMTRSAPTPVSLSRDALAIAARGASACALLDDQRVQCWGFNGNGQLGTGDMVDPVGGFGPALSFGQNVLDLAMSYTHACVRLADHTMRCWGNNSSGEIGVGDVLPRFTPTAPSGLSSDVLEVAVGDGYTCALLADGTLRCWGINNYGQLGDGAPSLRPLPASESIDFGQDIAQLSVGYFPNACVVTTDHEARCWGNNYWGQLGTGDKIWRDEPGPALALGADVVEISLGYYATCALLSGGSVKCWGINGSGQLGYGDTLDRLSIPSAPIALGGNATSVAAGNSYACAILDDHSVKCWGTGSATGYGMPYTMIASPPAETLDIDGDVVQLTAGEGHVCALLDDHSIHCWGYNSYGQLGYGDTLERSEPESVPVALGGDAIAVSAARFHTCAVLSDGGVKCWGSNNYLELGYGDAVQRLQPSTTTIALNGPATNVFAMQSHTCALLATGALQCWGSQWSGELGTNSDPETGSGTPSAPLAIDSTVLSVGGSNATSCALLADQSVRCWGDNATGGLGDGLGLVWAPSGAVNVRQRH